MHPDHSYTDHCTLADARHRRVKREVEEDDDEPDGLYYIYVSLMLA